MSGQPDLILQLAHHIRDDFRARGHARVEGDLVPLMANLRYVKDLLAQPRGRV